MGDIKNILVNGKHVFEKMCSPSDFFVMVTDLSNGHEFGISYNGCFTMDYSLIGSVSIS